VWRHKWRRQAGNKGIVRILVPAEALDRLRDGIGTDLAHDPRRDPSDVPRAIIALEAAISTLREQLEQANSRADPAEVRAEQVDSLRAEHAAEQGRADARAARDRAAAAELADTARGRPASWLGSGPCGRESRGEARTLAPRSGGRYLHALARPMSGLPARGFGGVTAPGCTFKSATRPHPLPMMRKAPRPLGGGRWRRSAATVRPRGN